MKKASLKPVIIALSICCLCISVAAFAYWDLTRFQQQQPPLIVKPAVIDFGKIEAQDSVRGTSSINILVRSRCGCFMLSFLVRVMM